MENILSHFIDVAKSILESQTPSYAKYLKSITTTYLSDLFENFEFIINGWCILLINLVTVLIDCWNYKF